MKKLYVLLLAVLFPTYLLGALTGSGTAAAPYYGTITTPVTWDASSGESGTVYVGRTSRPITGITIGDGGSLTIISGVTVVFTGLTIDLIITGSGVLTVNGTSSANVTFTKASSIANWGQVYFNAPTGASSINYCNISYGYANNDASGGGIYILSSSSVTIKNSVINNCTANFGGGIEIFDSSPTIENCVIRDNTGAGIDIYNDTGTSSPTITNCTIVDNTNSFGNGGYGGIQNSGGTPIINNCIFWKNIGDGGMDYTGGGSITYSATTQGITGTGMITLSATNTDATGPNFTDPSTNDYSITFVSPCRDAGTIAGLTTDILGKSRIGNYDMGAYECQYSKWTGSAADNLWATASNWEQSVAPSTGTGDVYIPAGLSSYPTGSSSQDFTIASGKYMILEPGAHATLNTLTNNGTLKLNASSSGLASLILNSYTRGSGGVEQVQLYLTGGGDVTTYKWHYISSPFTTLAADPFSSYTLDLAQWAESRPATELLQGWVAYDGYDYSNGLYDGPTFSTLDPGKGYDYYKNADNTFTLAGLFNTTDVSASLSFTTSSNDDLHGLNLIGNPFSSGLDWDYITTHTFPGSTTKCLYFTRNNSLCTYSNGVGVPSDVTGIIPPMQGFFSKTYSAGNTIVLAAAARTHTNIHSTYKKSIEVIPLVRLSLTDGTQSDETVVRFDNNAKSTLDYDYDAVKMFLSPDATSIYSSLSGTNYAINGLPFPETSVEIPVTLNLTTDAATKTITSTQLQGLDGYDVTLTDNNTSVTTNLKTTPAVTFAADKGNVAGRFILKVATIITGTEIPAVTINKFNIYPANNRINILTLADDWDGKTGSVRVLDLNGNIENDLSNAEFHKNSLVQVDAPAVQGLYFVELKSGNMRYVGKVVIR